MKRRDFLKTAALAVASPAVASPINDNRSRYFGWRPGYQHVSSLSFTDYKSLGENSIACLWEPWEKIHGPWICANQEWMDCVAQTSGGALELLTAIHNHKYIAKPSTDLIYSGGRNLIGDTNGHGMYGIWAVRWLREYGKLLRADYGRYDLTNYSKQTCLHWDRFGVPQSLQAIAKKTPLLKYLHIKDWQQCRDAVASGHPVLFCAGLGAENSHRDKDGFIEPRGYWPHAWLLAGIDDGERPGACLINSHGKNWASGPKRHNNPDGSVWVDKKYIDYHLKKYSDSYALCLTTEDQPPLPIPPAPTPQPQPRPLFPWLRRIFNR